METSTAARERLNGPEWVAFIEGLTLALHEHPDRGPGFWRDVDFAQADLFDGLADEDADGVEVAVTQELARRNIYREI